MRKYGVFASRCSGQSGHGLFSVEVRPHILRQRTFEETLLHALRGPSAAALWDPNSKNARGYRPKFSLREPKVEWRADNFMGSSRLRRCKPNRWGPANLALLNDRGVSG